MTRRLVALMAAAVLAWFGYDYDYGYAPYAGAPAPTV
jgi:hypothetical protein